MKHEFKPGDPVMVPGTVLEIGKIYVKIELRNGDHWFFPDDIHPIPTPPRPLRVDELVKDERYEFDDCGARTQGRFTGMIIGKFAIIEIDSANGLFGCNVAESHNIRPVERVVSDEEIMKVFNTKMFDSSVADAVVKTVRHFMKGGSDEAK